ncbi:MAG TPA: hypothetical protein VLE89_00830 [Chlamydiales bacterium]|nr:hypothetical protein [Chlamydiales bacterium]
MSAIGNIRTPSPFETSSSSSSSSNETDPMVTEAALRSLIGVVNQAVASSIPGQKRMYAQEGLDRINSRWFARLPNPIQRQYAAPLRCRLFTNLAIAALQEACPNWPEGKTDPAKLQEVASFLTQSAKAQVDPHVSQAESKLLDLDLSMASALYFIVRDSPATETNMCDLCMAQEILQNRLSSFRNNSEFATPFKVVSEMIARKKHPGFCFDSSQQTHANLQMIEEIIHGLSDLQVSPVLLDPEKLRVLMGMIRMEDILRQSPRIWSSNSLIITLLVDLDLDEPLTGWPLTSNQVEENKKMCSEMFSTISNWKTSPAFSEPLFLSGMVTRVSLEREAMRGRVYVRVD